jgi:hypothetical protein
MYWNAKCDHENKHISHGSKKPLRLLIQETKILPSVLKNLRIEKNLRRKWTILDDG